MKGVIAILLLSTLVSCQQESKFQQGVLEYRQGNFREAIRLLNDEISEHPANANAYYEKGNCYLRLGEYTTSLEQFDRAIEIEPHPAFFGNRSTVKAFMGNYEGAIEDASIAISKKKDYYDAYQTRASSYSRLGKYDKAVEDLNFVLQNDPSNIQAIANLGDAYRRMNRVEEACEVWSKIRGVAEVDSMIKLYCD